MKRGIRRFSLLPRGAPLGLLPVVSLFFVVNVVKSISTRGWANRIVAIGPAITLRRTEHLTAAAALPSPLARFRGVQFVLFRFRLCSVVAVALGCCQRAGLSMSPPWAWRIRHSILSQRECCSRAKATGKGQGVLCPSSPPKNDTKKFWIFFAWQHHKFTNN